MVSILISAKGKLEELTRPCIERVHATVRIPYEIIGIDDGSKDNTFAYMRQRCHKAIQTKGIGCGASRNLGLLYATGDHIMFLDNDVFVNRPGWLRTLVTEGAKANVGIIGPVLSNEYLRGTYPRSADGLIDVDNVAGACFMFPRSTFNRLGMLDKQFSRRGEDTDYCFRAKLAGLRVCITPRLLIEHVGAQTYSWRKELGQLRRFREKYRNYVGVLSVP